MQTKKELEDWYAAEDPWNYKTNMDDQIRKEIILSFFEKIIYNKALDIGAGEGFITKDLPAKIIHGIEISDLAASRFDKKIKRIFEPEELYDLVITTGTLYSQYDYKKITETIKKYSCKHILISGIKDWLILDNFGKIIKEKEYKYREYTQRTILYEIST
jgi:hypothetical protein